MSNNSLLATVLYGNFSGKWLGSRQIRCNWAAKGAGTSDDKQNSDSKSVVELTNGSSGQYLGNKNLITMRMTRIKYNYMTL